MNLDAPLWSGLLDEAALISAPGSAPGSPEERQAARRPREAGPSEDAERHSAQLRLEVERFRQLRSGAAGASIGSLLVPDHALQAVARACSGTGAGSPTGPVTEYPIRHPNEHPAEDAAQSGGGTREALDVTVLNTGGAGGLVALARRAVDGVRLRAVISPLRDVADPVGNAARIIAASAELAAGIEVYVELPQQLPTAGFIGAVAELEAAGLSGALRLDSDAPWTPTGLADRLSLLIEADLPFALLGLGDLEDRQLGTGPSRGQGIAHRSTQRSAQRSTQPSDEGAAGVTAPGAAAAVLSLLRMVLLLVDGAEPAEAAVASPGARVSPGGGQSRSDQPRSGHPRSDLLDQLLDEVAGWSDQVGQRVRRRLRRIGCADLAPIVAHLSRRGALEHHP